MKTKYLISSVAIVLVALIAYKLSANKKKINEKNSQAPVFAVRIPVKVDSARQEVFEINIVKTGSLAPFKEVKALSRTSGTIQQLRFDQGDHVTKGQVLAVTDTRLLQLELQKAETQAAKLRNDLKTYTELLEGRAATQEYVNEIRLDYLDAVNLVNQAKKNIADAVIKSPIGGIVSVKSVEQGVYVNSGGEIATIVNLSKAKVQVYLTEGEVYQVSEGQRVRITADVFPGKVFSGTISFISPQADETHSYLAEIMVDNRQGPTLRSGTVVYADFSRKTKQVMLVIPRDAITESVESTTVFVVSDNVVHRRTIQTDNERDCRVEVINGLKPGDAVVTSGQINLKEGTPVRVTN